ncbi:hypothetical protein HK104_009152 [Borealophlyctis nickersoniae]|nr:hypothetical protein HK104_009152 [Borealophlyctis nickersoniae]
MPLRPLLEGQTDLKSDYHLTAPSTSPDMPPTLFATIRTEVRLNPVAAEGVQVVRVEEDVGGAAPSGKQNEGMKDEKLWSEETEDVAEGH